MIFWQFAKRQVDRRINMNWLFSVVLTVHILVALAIIGLVLMQHGKGADMGAAFGSGASGSLFGATGSANFLSRTTGVLAAVFFATSLTLAYVASNQPKTTGSVMQETVQLPPVSQPAVAGGDAPTSPAGAGSKAKDIPK
ncbi:preprotein translocase subunit SecG [Dechloromonas denitrificans]|uniref:preprotein translocase subunit SecG n=1 Tax=Dechloromonas denitrificans TaxID=281362 RepID=UPI001CF8EC97|nr:preprotein translocase subunit SecG [Dechloromonas denitrificans]